MSDDSPKAAQVARLEVRLKVLAMEIVTIMRAALATQDTDHRVDALITSLQLEQVVHAYGVRQILRLSELPLSTQSQQTLDDLESILEDENRTNAGRLAAAAQLLLGDRPRIERNRTIH